MDQLLEVGNRAVKHAEKLGAQEAEIFLYTENRTSVRLIGGVFALRGGAVKGVKGSLARIMEPWIKKKGIPMITSGVRAGIGVRAIINKAIGFSSVSSLEEKRVLEAVEEAVQIAKIIPADPNWTSLPDPMKPTGQGGIFDKRFPDIDVKQMLDVAVDCCVTAADYDKRITQTTAMTFAASTSLGIVNTRGVEAHDQGTFFMAILYTKAKSGSEEVSSGDSLFSRIFPGDLRPVALSASKKTIECFGKKALPEKYVGPVVFENISWNELFSAIFTHGISALNVQENRSVYKGKIGSQVAKENFTVIDDGTLPEGFGTGKIDDEAIPRQKTTLIEKGTLTGFLYDNYCAKRDNRPSTGNGSRQRLYGSTAYANQPEIRPTNLLIAPGSAGLEGLVGEMKNGVLVKGFLIGAFHSNIVTGDFSVTAENAFKVENGSVAYPLKACTVAGNLYEALNSITAIGNDVKCLANVVNPSVMIEKIVVAT